MTLPAATQPNPQRALWRVLALLLTIIGFIVSAAGTASALTATTAHSSSGESRVVGPETRVGVTTHFSGRSSARLATIRAGCVGESRPVYGGFVLASCVATNTGGAAGEVGETSIHGAERVAGPAATRGGVLSSAEIAEVRTGAQQAFSQSNGATAKVFQQADGRFSVVVDGDRGFMTSFKNLSQGSLDRLAKNYGWKPK